jgi:hypothetical protein
MLDVMEKYTGRYGRCSTCQQYNEMRHLPHQYRPRHCSGVGGLRSWVGLGARIVARPLFTLIPG